MADVGRITELWRAAADALERTEREQTLEVIQTIDAIAHLRKQRDELQAECGRLREQLDAATTVVEVAREYRAAEEAFQAVFDFENRPDENARLALCARGEAARSHLDAALARAALGVEGEPE